MEMYEVKIKFSTRKLSNHDMECLDTMLSDVITVVTDSHDVIVGEYDEIERMYD